MTLLPAILWLMLAGQSPTVDVRATVWIRAGDRGVGTGWVVDTERRWVVTARHIVGDHDTVDVYFLDRAFNHPVNERRHYVADQADLQRRGLIATGRVVARRDASDLVLLSLDHLPPGTAALTLAAHGARLGDSCHSIGHRHDAEVMWNRADGHIRQIGPLAEGYFWAGKRLGAGVPLLLIQSPIESGESGSALLNADGKVIGVVSALVQPTPGLAIAIDGSEVRALLADGRKEPATIPSPIDLPTRPNALALERATVWVRPQATSGRSAGVSIDAERGLVLTSATAVSQELIVDVVVPRRDLGRLIPNADEYRDLLGLRLTGQCVQGVVLARDPVRDLALIEIDSLPVGLESPRLANAEAKMGDRIAAMGHPTGIDLLWLYAAGTVRSVGTVQLSRDVTEDSPKVRASLLQLPHQGSASGGPVVNEAGELVGILSARESARQELAFAATPGEIRAFLDATRSLTEPKTSSEWEARARFLMKAGRLDKSIIAFRAASVAGSGYALALCCSGESAEARKVVELKLKQSPSAPTLAELAEVCRQLGDRERAGELADRALKGDARCALALVVRARLRTGKAAADDVAEALFLNPNLAAAYHVRAGLRDRTSNAGRRDAIADWSRTLELNPIDPEALQERARLHEQINEPKKAVADWTRISELSPLRMESWIGLAKARFSAGDRAGGAAALVSAARVAPDRRREVFQVVVELGQKLEMDNSADTQRIKDWNSLALVQLAPWLPE